MSDSSKEDQKTYSSCVMEKEQRAYISKSNVWKVNTVPIIAANLCEACNYNAVKCSTLARWFKWFQEEKWSMEDDARTNCYSATIDNTSMVILGIDIIYYYVIWTDNGSRLLEADTRRQEGKYPMIKVLQGCILKLSLYSVNTAFIHYGTGNMQSAILLSFIASSSLPPCGLQSTHPQVSCYISPYVVYYVYGYIPIKFQCLGAFYSLLQAL